MSVCLHKQVTLGWWPSWHQGQGDTVCRVRRTCHQPGSTLHLTKEKGTDVRGDTCMDSAVLGSQQHEVIFVGCRPCAVMWHGLFGCCYVISQTAMWSERAHPSVQFRKLFWKSQITCSKHVNWQIQNLSPSLSDSKDYVFVVLVFSCKLPS